MLHLLVGIQGSGKTTFSKELSQKLNCPLVSSDGVRNIHPTWSEDLIWPEIYRLIAESLKKNEDVVYDATNITPKVRKRVKDNIEQLGATFKAIAYFLDTPIDECIKRVEKRNEMVGERFLPLEVIESYQKSLVIPTLDEGFDAIKIIKNGEIVKIIE